MSSVTEKQFDQFKDLPPWSQQGLRLKGKRGSRSKKRNSLPPKADCLFLFIPPGRRPMSWKRGRRQEKEKPNKKYLYPVKSNECWPFNWG